MATVTTIVPNLAIAEVVSLTRLEISLIVPDVLLVMFFLVHISFTLFIKHLTNRCRYTVPLIVFVNIFLL